MIGFIARFPHTAAGVILTLHVALTLGLGYGQAGLAAAAMTLGIAVGAPWRGRVIDKRGLRRALIPSVIGEAVIWPLVPWLPFPWMLLAVFAGGVLAVPIFSVVRQGLGVLTHGRERQTAFALDSIITETIFMVGPALGAVVAAGWSTAWGLTIVGLSGALGGALLMWFNPPTHSRQVEQRGGTGGGGGGSGNDAGGSTGGDAGSRADGVGKTTGGGSHAAPESDDYTEAEEQQRAIAQSVQAAPLHVDVAAAQLTTGAIPVVTSAIPAVTGSLPVIQPGGTVAQAPSRRERLRAWRERSFSWVSPPAVAVMLVSMAAGMVLVGTEVTMVAELERQGQAGSVGIVYAFWCGASAIGGLIYGARGKEINPLLLMTLFTVFTVPLAFVDGLWALAFASIPSGLVTAPTLAASSARLASLVPEERRGEAMGFYGSALTAGAAMGAPLAGVFIDAIDPAAGYLVAAASGLLIVTVAVVLTLASRRRTG